MILDLDTVWGLGIGAIVCIGIAMALTGLFGAILDRLLDALVGDDHD